MDQKKINAVKRSIFDPERAVWRGLSRFMDWVYLSVLWLICSLPVVTIGAATAALCSSADHCLRKQDDTILSRFFSAFRREFRLGTAAGCLWALVLGLYGVLWLFLFSLGDSMPAYALMASAFVGSFLSLGALCWVFPILAGYQVTFRELNRQALHLALAHAGSTLLMEMGVIVCVLACWTWMFPLMVLPGALADLCSLLTQRAFARHQSVSDAAGSQQDDC